MAPAKRCAQAGFTLVELISAGGIFLLGLSSVLLLDRSSAAETARAAHRARAQGLLAEVVSLYNVLPLQQVAKQTAPLTETFDILGNPTPSGSAFFTVTSQAVTNSRQGLDVSVQVRWTEPGGQSPPPLTAQRTLPAP